MLQPRKDALPGCDYFVWQQPDGFCYGTDSVLLAAFARCYGTAAVLDLGCGTGAIGMLLAARWAKATLTGVDIDPRAAELAARSAADNGLAGRVTIHRLDYRRLITGQPAEFAFADGGGQDKADTAHTMRGRYDIVVCNPPFCAEQAGPVHTRHADARAEVNARMQEVVCAAVAALTPNGQLFAIYPASRIAELCGRLFGAGFAVKRLVLVHPLPGKPANRVLCQAVRQGGQGCRVEDFVLYSAPGEYTPQAKAVYAGAPL